MGYETNENNDLFDKIFDFYKTIPNGYLYYDGTIFDFRGRRNYNRLDKFTWFTKIEKIERILE